MTRQLLALFLAAIAIAIWSCIAYLAQRLLDVPFWFVFGVIGAIALLVRNMRAAWHAEKL